MAETASEARAGEAGAGLAGALKRLGDHGLELLQLRLALLGTELEAEKLRLASGLLFALAALVLLAAGLTLLSTALLWLSPEAWRGWVALGLALSFFALGGWLLQRGHRALSAPSGLFAASLAELRRDRQSLED